ncbi:hypothetical protein NQ314_007637 [Rhamnusium bicolor]|uniref:PiggyBac transposable element-derived protein domain-containing protein n=1 Tax=Rhamnusium bicolor TaxID=1586634 RepID=A0AAV8YLG7_9CUCU|nr:hypothetical protein NQ314_007637 [Rhamnusium bicolor]
MEKLLNEGRIICDNFYTSLPLAQELLSKKTFVCGTLRSNRKGIPKEITSKKLKRGDIIALENNEGVKILKWVDKPVMMLTTCKNRLCKIIETGKNNRKGEQIKKPDAVICYNLGKKGVDMSDHMASYYTTKNHKMVQEGHNGDIIWDHASECMGSTK